LSSVVLVVFIVNMRYFRPWSKPRGSATTGGMPIRSWKPAPWGRRHAVAGLLLLPVVCYALAILAVASQQRALLFMTNDDGRLAAAGGLAVPRSERVVITASDGVETTGWYVAPAAGQPVILFFHGQGGQLVHLNHRWERIRQAGLGILAFSYRGYPGSAGTPRSGTPSEDGIHRDARAAYAWLRVRHPADGIVLHGHSLGSGVAVRLAAEVEGGRGARALVLEAPFTAAVDVAAERMPWAPVNLLMRDPFRSRDWIGRVKMPVLIVHGDRDSVVPFAHGERLYAAAVGPKRFVAMPGSEHNTLVRDGLYDHVFQFVRALPPAAAMP
jgi:uncharacterized protein